ncbi:hypothetical protein ACFWDI_02945 [Streptomyces sp. NPDC060064]|uniref:hypothetical protein n=1 Tax=Streptomyces sp. NPDC060064 TaxID=3347049 RepID=UPI00368F2270
MRSGYLMHRYVHRLLDGCASFSYSTDGAEMGKLMVAEGLGATVLPDFSVMDARWNDAARSPTGRSRTTARGCCWSSSADRPARFRGPNRICTRPLWRGPMRWRSLRQLPL